MKPLKRSKGMVVAGVAVALVAAVVGFEPVTRHLVAVDGVCAYCHVSKEYESDVRLPYSKPHPAIGEDGAVPQPQARCVECHLAPGFVDAIFAYTHYASLTDLFGHFRDRNAERAGRWLPARQAAAYRVRDRLFEYDSATCRSCHVMEEIEPKRERGVNAHQKAIDETKTCIECHYNEKHRTVDLRENPFPRPGQAEES
jgi:nitrate/TMAO reductase-like tetraheme cytochrome c subunit